MAFSWFADIRVYEAAAVGFGPSPLEKLTVLTKVWVCEVTAVAVNIKQYLWHCAVNVQEQHFFSVVCAALFLVNVCTHC